MSAHLAAQRAIVRMLFDPSFAAAARSAPDEVLAALPPPLRAQLAAIDPRALATDPLRRRRALRTLSDELKGSTTLALAETRSLAFLEQFFAGVEFHQCVEARGSLALAFAAHLARALTEGRLRDPRLGGVLAIETALARSRRAFAEAGPAQPPADLDDARRIARGPGVIPIDTMATALETIAQCERYLFEVGLMPAVALCDDAPRLPPPLASDDGARLHLLTVPTASGVSLVTIDDELYRLLRALDDPRTVRQALAEAEARGVGRARGRALLAELVGDEIVVAA